MSAIRTPGTSFSYRPSVLTPGPYLDPAITTPDAVRGGRLREILPTLGPIASGALRSLVLIAIAMLLILVLLPAALVAAATQVASAG